jgi:hypothetical protein
VETDFYSTGRNQRSASAHFYGFVSVCVQQREACDNGVQVGKCCVDTPQLGNNYPIVFWRVFF